jgi:hypothetical protein
MDAASTAEIRLSQQRCFYEQGARVGWPKRRGRVSLQWVEFESKYIAVFPSARLTLKEHESCCVEGSFSGAPRVINVVQPRESA